MYPANGQNKFECPLVSIALCTYNGARFIREQLESLLQQDYPNLEVVVCDDRSLDDTVRVISSYKDPRITRIVVNETNLGFRRNFVKAFGLCRGELIAPCDQDDIWLPNKISMLVNCLIAGGHTMVYCDSAYVAEDGTPLNRNQSDDIPTYSGNDPTALVARNCVSGHAMLFRREVLAAAHPIPQRQYHDWWIAMVAASMGSVQFVKAPLVKFRRHSATQTRIGHAKKLKSHNTPPNKTAETEAFVERLAFAWANPSHPSHGDLDNLLDAFQKWQTSWFCLDWALIIWRHQERLFPNGFFHKPKRFVRALRLFFGLKTKRFVSPRRYP